MTTKAKAGDTVEQDFHRDTHKELHENLDELVADFISHNNQKRLSTTTILELMQWSHEQTKKPTKAL